MHLALADDVEVGHRRGRREEQRHVDEQHLVPAHVVADDHRREHEDREQHHQHVVEVRGEVEERLGLHAERLIRLQDARQELAAGLDRALRPAVLLRLEGVHLDRKLGRHDDVRQEVELPAAQLRAVAEVEILGQRVVLPAAAVNDRGAAPDARGAVEVEEVARAVAAAVLEDEVRVEQHRLDARQQRVVLVDVAPARLHDRDLRVGEVVHGAQQEIGLRQEVGVEDRDELALGDVHARLERAGLVARAIAAVQIGDVDPVRRGATNCQLSDGPRLVGRVVQHLDFELVPRVVHLADRLDQPVHDVHLVVDGQLNGDGRQLVELAQRNRHLVPVLHVGVHQVVAVPPIASQNDQDEEVGGERQRFERSHLRAGPRGKKPCNNYTADRSKVKKTKALTAFSGSQALSQQVTIPRR